MRMILDEIVGKQCCVVDHILSVRRAVIPCVTHKCIIGADAFPILSFFCEVSIFSCNVCGPFKISERCKVNKWLTAAISIWLKCDAHASDLKTLPKICTTHLTRDFETRSLFFFIYLLWLIVRVKCSPWCFPIWCNLFERFAPHMPRPICTQFLCHFHSN